MFVSSMANHEKSKKHKENLAALKLILQEETGGTQSPDGLNSIDNTTAAKCDRLSDNSDTHSDTGDGYDDTGNDNRELSDTTQQFPSNTTSDTLVVKHSVSSTDKGADNDSVNSVDEDDILLLLAKNKTKQASGYHEDKFELVSKETSDKPEESITQDERYNNCSKMV